MRGHEFASPISTVLLPLSLSSQTWHLPITKILLAEVPVAFYLRLRFENGKRAIMRSKIVALSMFAALSSFGTAAPALAAQQTDPYLWCAVYDSSGAENCFYKTLEQCRAAITGGGACSPNLAYDRSAKGGLGRRHHALRY